MLASVWEEVKQLPRPHPVATAAFVVFIGLLLYAYRIILTDYWLENWGHPDGYYSYAYLVIPLALAIIWFRRAHLIRLQAQPSAWGIPVLLLAIVLRMSGHWGESHWVSSMGFPLFLLGASLLTLGKSITRVLLYPILYLYFMIPLPDWVFDEVTYPIKVWSTDTAFILLSPFYKLWPMSEVQFMMPSGYGVSVGVECSGFKVTVSLLTFLFFFFTILDLPLWKKALLVVSVLPPAILANAIRIALIAIAGHHFGDHAAKIAHEGWEVTLPLLGNLTIPTTGLVEIAIPFACLFLFARWLGWKRLE